MSLNSSTRHAVSAVELCHAVPCNVILCHAILCHAMLCHAMQRCAVLCHSVPCLVVPYHAVKCCAMPCHAVSIPGAEQTCEAGPPWPASVQFAAGGVDIRGSPSHFLSQALCPLRGAAHPSRCRDREPCQGGESPFPPLFIHHVRWLRHRMPSLPSLGGGGAGNRWREEALGHHQLLLSLADDTECKFCWHYSLRLFCLCIPPVLITVIEL